ncbi:3-keto-disaccharide hydrolase [Allorhodopirellula heiligendammensis]|uniref:3-keto-alpha-glucoside-1,2-lyase/3-keto-2-hydroxy-glucal hydratase domain-containing protein n=1 Tax=Allorhodopirellula heiligendammensis TaxID=2714739 RepID=A0A5C6C2J2_9BACT|nr:DUF1080 domain-containing protein [Allorhodopirellula heiligendammensis]TWU18358.1 hypothetical protein Poly21_05200 [Allorhodopirellula heiligendammensis]|tara:strand:+ start:973 stop:1725 length:753 start_codon:yes stop_codon:yes gene_type:complete
MKKYLFNSIAVLSLVCSCSWAVAEEYLTGIDWAEPEIVTPGKTDNDPPSDATVLFGKASDISNWKGADTWKTDGDVLITGSGMIRSEAEFGDCQVHIEWSAPTPPKGNSQGRGNSGVFLMGIYEMQVLDSFDNKTYFDGQAASIYKQTPPAVNAMRPPGEWNSYDIFWTAPRFSEDGELESPAYITATHNGVLVLNHFALLGDTPFNRAPQYKDRGPQGPIALQDHGNPVRFRNIWVRDYKPAQKATEKE